MMTPKKFSIPAARLGLFFAFVAAFGFSMKAIFVKLAYPYGVDAITLLALRMAFSLPVFLWVGFRQHGSGVSLTRRDWLQMLLLGSLGFYGASILDFMRLKYISAGLERLILFTYPTMIILIGIVFQGKRFVWREAVAVVLSYLGIACAFLHDLSFGETSAVMIGGALVFASGVSYALYMSGSGAMIARLGSMRFTALAMLVSSAVTLLHFGATHDVGQLVQPWPLYGLVLAMAMFSTVIPVFAQSAAIRHLGANRAALTGMVGPMLTIVLGWWVLGEHISGAQILGAVLVVAGILVVTRRA